MGGKTSKSQPGLSRSFSIRKSQRTTLHKIQRKLDKVSRDIHNFTGSIEDPKHATIKLMIAQIIDELEKISTVVKDKHKNAYQDILNRCNHQLQQLETKVINSSRPTSATSLPPPASSPIISPIASPISLPPSSPLSSPYSSPPTSPIPIESPTSERSVPSVQVKVVNVMLENEPKQSPIIKKEKRVKKVEFSSNSSLEDDPTSQMNAIDSIDSMRRKIENLEEQIHLYKQEKDPSMFALIRASLMQTIIKLDNMETYGNIQVKHERKLALQRAQECLKYLEDGTESKARNLQTQVIVEMHQRTTSPTEAHEVGRDHHSTYTRPVTLDLNVNEQLKEELHQVIHKRIEEAINDSKSVDEDENKNDTKASSFENFVNTDSEDDYDFVTVDGDKELSKSTPMLVTSL